MRRVLLAMGDENQAEGFRRALRAFESHWALWNVTSTALLREAVSAGAPQAVILDASLAGDGLEALLAELAATAPTTVRAVLCGPTVRAEQAQRLVARAHQVLRTPMVPAQVFEVVERSCLVMDALASERLKGVIGRLGTLPALPQTYARLAQMTQDPDCSLDAVAAVVERDPGITANVLKIINSAYFGLPRRVASVKETVRYLGIQPVKNLVLTVELFDGIGGTPKATSLQQHALARACAMREVLGRTALAELAFAAGILCDVGALLVEARLTVDAMAVARAQAAGAERDEAERERLACTHAEVGAALLRQWNLPQALVEAVALHHHPPEGVPPANVTSALQLVCALEELGTASPRRQALLNSAIAALSEAFPTVALDAVQKQFALATAA